LKILLRDERYFILGILESTQRCTLYSTDMDFLKQAQQALDSTQEAVQGAVHDVAHQLNEAVTSLNQAAIDATEQGKDKVTEIVASGTEAVEQGSNAIANAYENTTAQVVGVGATGMTIAQTLKDLPQTAEELAREMPKIAQRLRHGAGLRPGEAPRSDAEVMQLFNKIPVTSKLDASERNIQDFLSNKHGSHIHSHQKGGSGRADNIVWEIGADNIRRGARNMTGGEQIYIRFHNAIESILQNSGAIARLGLAATGTAILTQAVVTAASYALDLYRGDLTVEEFNDRIIEAAVSAGIATPIFFLIFIAVLALFPELVIILSAPAVVAGFNILFGISIAAPIVQSIIRHVEADGFGEDVAQGYEDVVSQVDQIFQAVFSDDQGAPNSLNF
jgi:hypothetical protein